MCVELKMIDYNTCKFRRLFELLLPLFRLRTILAFQRLMWFLQRMSMTWCSDVPRRLRFCHLQPLSCDIFRCKTNIVGRCLCSSSDSLRKLLQLMYLRLGNYWGQVLFNLVFSWFNGFQESAGTCDEATPPPTKSPSAMERMPSLPCGSAETWLLCVLEVLNCFSHVRQRRGQKVCGCKFISCESFVAICCQNKAGRRICQFFTLMLLLFTHKGSCYIMLLVEVKCVVFDIGVWQRGRDDSMGGP